MVSVERVALSPFAGIIMSSPNKTSPKKKSKKKVAVKASYGGISFDKHASADASGTNDEVKEEEDPLASYRVAAAAATKALEKEHKEHAQLKLFTKIFATMDRDGDGTVELAEMIEAVASSTAPLSNRSSVQGRPTGAISLQLPMLFTLDMWVQEMRRVQALRRGMELVAYFLSTMPPLPLTTSFDPR